MKKVAILLSLIATISADQLKVPSAYSTIQAGLNAASSGDTVLVAAGTYTENIMWPDVNGIKLISAGDSSNTIIDGGGISSVIYINPQTATIDTTTLIQGFKIMNGGNVTSGGGMVIVNASPSLNKLFFINNEAANKGGTLYIDNSDLKIVNTTITESAVTTNQNAYGGGIYLSNSNPQIKGLIIKDTNCPDYSMGGGIYAINSSVVENVYFENTYAKSGAGVYSENTLIRNCIFNNTRTWSLGAAIYVRNGNEKEKVSNCTFYNFTQGSVIVYRANIYNCLFYNNSMPAIQEFTEVDSCIFSNSSSGVILYNSDTNQKVSNSIFSNLTDAISYMWDYESGSRNFVNCTFDNNKTLFNTNNPNQVFQYCNIINNGKINNSNNLELLDMKNNYWGDSSGPYHPTQNSSGKGDSVNAYVNVDPWLTAPNTDAPPIPAQNLKLDSQTVTSATFSWDASKIGDLSGYKIYYDTDTTGYPYANSVDLGNVVTKSLTGLTAGKTYYVAVSTYDTDGNESWYSKEVSVTMNNTPVIAAVSDVTMNEDESSTITLTATDVENDAITYSAVSDTNTVSVSVSSATLTLTPNANWHGVANIKAYASDGSSKDSTSFKLTVTPINDAPTAFEWVSIALDTVNITQSNLADTYTLQWGGSTDPIDGDSITYLLYAGTGASPKEEVYDTTSTSLPIPYQEFLQKTFEQIPMLSRATVRFSVYAYDGTDSVKVTGDDRVVFVNRYEYLSTESEGIPTEFALHENYPNPFNPTTTLRFDLPEISDITLTIYNMLGQKVKTFNMQSTPAGYHSIKWDATNDYGDPVGAGVYLYQLRANEFVKTKKMVLLK